MSKVKVIGHTPPDTDSICSPIVYAWYLNNIKGVDAVACKTGEVNNESNYVLQHFGVEEPGEVREIVEGDKLVVVDTNNPEELTDGFDEGEIIEVIDHHKLAGLSTSSPLKVTMAPVASTCTIIWDMMGDASSQLPKDIAGLMLAAILSDTLKFTSPTTTPHDKDVAESLAEVAGEDIEDLAEGMFAAKSDLTGMDTEEILLSDYKDFTFDDEQYRIGVLETTDPSQALDLEDELIESMQKIKEKEDLEGFFFFVVDILNTSAMLVLASDEEKSAAEDAFAKSAKGSLMELPGVVSRKKQMVPQLQEVLG